MKQLLLTIPIVTAVMVSCSDDKGITAEAQEADTAAITVLDGIPHYVTSQAYFDYGLKMANMDPEERKRLEAESGFTSMQTFAEGLLSDIDANETEILSRPEVFSFSADTIEDALMVRAGIEVPASMAVAANADGLYYIGDVICKVDRYCRASVRGGNAETVSRVLSGEVQANGETSHLFRYDLGGSTLKAAHIQIDEVKGNLSNRTLWTDYSARIYAEYDGENKKSVIYLQQESKNYQKKHRRWREHRGWNAYRDVNVMVFHPTVPDSIQRFYVDDYHGGNTVNHSCTREVKVTYNCNSSKGEAKAYFNSISGTISADGISAFMDLNTLFGEELKKRNNQ